ncbi:MAG: adenosine deaminase, partial [Gemmatimonadota bacterium]|nr:adenosine deaminase [Gemmatimonadota bacterium]
LMLTPDGGGASGMGRRAGYDQDLGRFRERLLAAGLRDTLAAAGVRLVREEERQREVLRCGTPLADAGCGVVVRYLYQVGRARTPEQVFAQILAGFEMASSDPRIVGFNLVQPEDNPVAMRDYSMQMGMIDFLHDLYPLVKITLHAGELAPGLVPPEGLRFHIREAIERGHASRIGHGVDVMHEDRPLELLEEMARRGVLVEIALSSNDVILGVRGPRHPLSAYMHYGVPVALATDDEGVSRSEMSMEYLKAAEEQGVGYSALKRMARNSLEYAFVEGESLWSDRRAFTLRGECAAAGGGLQSSACAALAERSTKARLQLELERAFPIFESEYAAIEATDTVRGR